MKFLAFVDLHEDARTRRELLARAGKSDIDFSICLGDFSTFGRGMKVVLKEFNALGKPFYVIPGNHEENAGLEEAVKEFPHCFFFHRKALFLPGGYVLCGYGGGGFAMEDAAFRKVAREWYGKYKEKKLILATHGPPFGTALDLLDNRHVGNRDYRRFIERIKPKLVLSGHLHETAGAVDTVGKTKLLNPGWEGRVIELK